MQHEATSDRRPSQPGLHSADCWPVAEVKDEEHGRKQRSAPLLHPGRQLLPAGVDQEGDEDKLEHKDVDKGQTHHHPDIQVGDIGHLLVTVK